MASRASPSPGDYPPPSPLLEEAAAARGRDRAACLAFALARLPEDSPKPLIFVLPHRWLSEHGRPCAQGIGGGALYLATPPNAAETLWTIEQALRSGAFAGVIGAVDGATLTQTRRLDFAAKLGNTACILLTSDTAGLSAARRRWRIAALPSAANPFDAQAPGRLRVHAELIRRRDGPPGAWLLEMDDETNRLRLADRLRHNGLVEHGRTIPAP